MEAESMKINVAGTDKEYAAGTTISQLIAAEDVESPDYVTVSINEDFVKSSEFSTRQLQENDKVEFLYFMGGGC
jgi:sulfur carrier protein